MTASNALGEDRTTRWVIAVVSFLVIGIVALVLFRAHTPAGNAAAQSILPTVNAALNATSAVLLTIGFACIRRRKIRAHQICMTTAFVVSSLFLITYLAHHAQVGSVRFVGPAWLQAVYLAVLIPHVLLSAAIVPLALTTLTYAWRSRFDRHRRLARWTLPIWLFVSVSGVVVYWMLYHLGSR